MAKVNQDTIRWIAILMLLFAEIIIFANEIKQENRISTIKTQINSIKR